MVIPYDDTMYELTAKWAKLGFGFYLLGYYETWNNYIDRNSTSGAA